MYVSNRAYKYGKDKECKMNKATLVEGKEYYWRGNPVIFVRLVNKHVAVVRYCFHSLKCVLVSELRPKKNNF